MKFSKKEIDSVLQKAKQDLEEIDFNIRYYQEQIDEWKKARPAAKLAVDVLEESFATASSAPRKTGKGFKDGKEASK